MKWFSNLKYRFKSLLNFKKNKGTVVSIISNIVIAVCIFSVFNLCFNTNIEQVSSTNYEAIYHGNTQKPNASLMINVYWGTEFIEPILEVLAEKNVKTTFFVGGYWVAQNEQLLKKIVEQGHEVANHGYYHKDHAHLSEEHNAQEMSLTHRMVKSATGVQMTLFAPPSGSYNITTLKVAASLNYKTIMWTKDTIDWRDKDENLVFSRATKNMKNGDLVLMHPTEHTYRALPNIIDSYKSAGFTLTTVTNTIS